MSSEIDPTPVPPPAPPKEPADQHAPPTPLTVAQRSTAAARALHDAGIIDLDAGLALIEHALEQPAFDAPAAVGQLKRLKPALFRAAAGSPHATGVRVAPSATMAPASPTDHRHEITRAAQRAAASGDRNALLTYMRAKRCLD